VVDSSRKDDTGDVVLNAPRSVWDLFLGFTWLAIQGFGAAAPVAYREIVERRKWLTPQDFAQDWAVAQLMPGPNAINLSLMVGDRFFGGKGAFASVLGMTCAPVLIVVTIATIYNEFSSIPMVAGALKAMGAVAAGLIIGTALKLLTNTDKKIFGTALTFGMAIVTFILMGILGWPLLWVLGSMCTLGTLWAYSRIRKLRHLGRSTT